MKVKGENYSSFIHTFIQLIFTYIIPLRKSHYNLVPRAHVSFVQHQDTELCKNQFPGIPQRYSICAGKAKNASAETLSLDAML